MDKVELQRMAVERREAALAYAADGWRVLRLYGIHLSKNGNLICDCRAGYKCTKSGKHPIDNRWTAIASSDVAVVGRWWDENPNANIGLLMGGGFITIDLDLLKPGDGGLNGFEEWEKIQEHCGVAPETRMGRTGSGGLHLVYREQPGFESGGSLLLALSGAKKIDQRGKGGLIVAPPSLHKSGKTYQWENEIEPALAPTWLYDTPGPFYGKSSKKTRAPRPVTPKSLVVRPSKLSDPDIDGRAKELTRQVNPDASLNESTMSLIRGGRRGDQSTLVFEICLGAAAVRFDYTKLFRLLEDPSNHGGLRLRQEIERKGPDRALEWFAITWEAVQRYRAASLAPIDQLREEAEHYEWRTVTFIARNGKPCTVRHQSMAKVLDAAFDLAGRYTTTEPMLSQKVVAEIAHLSIKTVRKGLAGLEVLGWVELEEKTGVYNADIYSLVVDPEIRRSRLTSPELVAGTFNLLLLDREALLHDRYPSLADSEPLLAL
jgi:hypothetical protein